MKEYAFIKFVTPSFVCGKSVALYVNKKDDTKYLVKHETCMGKVISQRQIDGRTELNYFVALVEDAFQKHGVVAACDAAVEYVKEG